MLPEVVERMQAEFGSQAVANAGLARHTSCRLGGPAALLVEVHTADELARAAAILWELGAPVLVLGGGSNVLVSDAGVSQVVILNKAKAVHYHDAGQASEPGVWAETGANLGALARQAAARGLSGLEWAGGIPGTLGGALFGNAGAHGGDMAACLQVAEILQWNGQQAQRLEWPVEKFEYAYRTSSLKKSHIPAVILSARLRLSAGAPETVTARLEELGEKRRRSQPPGASLGSMFKNPPGDYAGRLIEAAGLKGSRLGGAQISPLHANFFVAADGARAQDVYGLICLARQTVAEKFGVELELEIELLGEWPAEHRPAGKGHREQEDRDA